MNFEFVIPTYKRPHQLMMTINCIYSQTATNWRISVVADAPYEGYDKVVDYFKGDDRIRFHTLEGGPHRDWGHTPRIYGMNNAQEEWLIMTGDDNYYFPCFLEAFNQNITESTNFIFCNMYHNYSNYVLDRCGIRKIPYGQNGSETLYRYEGMDIGVFATRTKLAQTVTFEKELHWADSKFAADYWEKHCMEGGKLKPGSAVHIDHAFYVHN